MSAHGHREILRQLFDPDYSRREEWLRKEAEAGGRRLRPSPGLRVRVVRRGPGAELRPTGERIVSGAEAMVWDTELAAQRAREAYRYVARVYPKDAPLEPLGRADRRVLEAQERRDWPAYEEALR